MKRGLDIKDRIEQSIERLPTGCWSWKLTKFVNGYGQIRKDGRTQYAHRVSFEALVAQIPDGMTIDHLCKVRCCVNPEHLRLLTRSENSKGADNTNKGAHNRVKTHCKNGHPFDETNTYLGSRIRAGKTYPTRACKTCNNNWYKSKEATN